MLIELLLPGFFILPAIFKKYIFRHRVSPVNIDDAFRDTQ